MNKKIYRRLMLLLVLLGLGMPVLAQSPITAKVDRATVSTDDFVNLTVVVTTASLSPPRPDLPPLNGFNVVGSSTSTQISMTNGKVTTQGVYQFRLQPTKTGSLTIPAISITARGQTYTTDPITVTVTQGSAPGQSSPAPGSSAPAPDTLNGQDFFVEASVDITDPYIGQQVIYTFRFYQATNLFDQPRYDAPNFTGFWSQQQPNQTQYTTQAAGRTYRVTELHTILFPTVSGKTTIEPAVLTIPGDIFSNGEILSAKPIDLTVKDLPANAPADFNGAVGNFTIAATVDNPQTKVNEPVTLKVTVSGDGNLGNLPDPQWTDIPGWRAFESKATTNSAFKNGKFSGMRVYERLLVPTLPGDETIPPLNYIYFDPTQGTYRTIKTNPIRVTVSAADDQPPVPTIAGDGKQDVSQLATDIRHIKPVPPLLASPRAPVTDSVGFWLLWGIPLLALAGNFIWVRRQAQLRQNTGLAQRLQARKRALKALATARTTHTDPYNAIGQALWGYIGDKLNRPVGGLTQTALAETLTRAGVDDETLHRVQSMMVECDMGQFSPTAGRIGHTEQLFNEVKLLIDDLEKVL